MPKLTQVHMAALGMWPSGATVGTGHIGVDGRVEKGSRSCIHKASSPSPPLTF